MNQYSRAGRCPIDVFMASNMGYNYPYKLVKPEHVNQKVVNTCETLIMDSGIGDEISNEEVLQLADEYDADFVVAKDYLHDQERTSKSILEFVDCWRDHNCRATPLIPLQPPHHEHWEQLNIECYHVMLGGMAFNADADDIIEAVSKFREAAGTGPYVHLLGVGANRRVMQFLADNPGMVQSLDCSTPEQCAINSSIFDVRLERTDYQIRNGSGSSVTRAGLAQHLAYTLCDAITMMHDQTTTTLGDFA